MRWKLAPFVSLSSRSKLWSPEVSSAACCLSLIPSPWRKNATYLQPYSLIFLFGWPFLYHWFNLFIFIFLYKNDRMVNDAFCIPESRIFSWSDAEVISSAHPYHNRQARKHNCWAGETVEHIKMPDTQAWWPEFDSKNPHKGGGWEPVPQGWPLCCAVAGVFQPYNTLTQ